MGQVIVDLPATPTRVESRSREFEVAASRLGVAAAGLAILTFVAIWIDLPVLGYARQLAPSSYFRHPHKLLDLAEVCGHSYGVALILLVAFVLEVKSKWKVGRIAACAYGAGMAADLAKLFIARVRPGYFPPGASVWESFVGLLPIVFGTSSEHPYGSALQSFPSGHTATAVGLAIGLGWCYPRGRWVFAGLALLAGLQRIESANHYLSDCLAGAALACLMGCVCVGPGPVGRFLRRWEAGRYSEPAAGE